MNVAVSEPIPNISSVFSVRVQARRFQLRVGASSASAEDARRTLRLSGVTNRGGEGGSRRALRLESARTHPLGAPRRPQRILEPRCCQRVLVEVLTRAAPRRTSVVRNDGRALHFTSGAPRSDLGRGRDVCGLVHFAHPLPVPRRRLRQLAVQGVRGVSLAAASAQLSALAALATATSSAMEEDAATLL